MNKIKKLNRGHLKLIAFITMMIDHLGCIFLAPETTMYYIIRLIVGRVAFPIFCVLFIEGFCHTRKEKYFKHIRDLLLFSILSEFPFDYFLLDKGFLYPSGQNVMFTWLLSFLMLWLLSVICKLKIAAASKYCIYAIVIFIFSFIFELFRVDYGFTAGLCVGIGFIAYQSMKSKDLWKIAAIVSIILIISYQTWFCLLCIISFLFYNGQPGRKYKYLYYIGYPLHITVLGLLHKVLL